MHIKFSSLNDLLCTAPIVYSKILAGLVHNLADARPNVFFLNKAFAFPADTGKKSHLLGTTPTRTQSETENVTDPHDKGCRRSGLFS